MLVRPLLMKGSNGRSRRHRRAHSRKQSASHRSHFVASSSSSSPPEMLSEALYPAGAGAIFGAALTASRVFVPSVIVGQFELKDFHMLHVFAVAMGSSA